MTILGATGGTKWFGQARARQRRVPLAMLPPVLLLVAAVAIPLAFLIYGSLRSAGPGVPDAVFTLDNWRYVFSDRALGYLRNSIVLGLATAFFAVPVGTVLAWIIVRTNLPGRNFLGLALLVPLLFSPLLTALAWTGLAAPKSGLVNIIARDLFGAESPVFDAYSFQGLVLVLALHYVPYAYLAVRPALTAMDRDMEDASQVLGARFWYTLRRVTLPLILPAVLSSAVLIAVLSAENFSVIAVLGGRSGFLTIPYGIYESFSTFPARPTRASALGLVLMIVTTLGMSLYLWSIRRSTRYVTVSGKGARSNVLKLSRQGKAAGLAVVIGYLLLSVILPYAVLVFGSFSRYFTIENFSLSMLTVQNYVRLAEGPFSSALVNTAIVTVVGATIAVFLGAITGWISVRGGPLQKRILDQLVAMPVMIPGVALGLGLFWAYVFLPLHIYGTLAALIVAYVTRFMAHGSRIVSSSLVQYSPQFEEAARTLGSTQFAAFRTITLRLLRPALGAAWILIAIFISLEVPASIMLYTGASIPASIEVYLSMESGVVSKSFAAGCALGTMTLLIIVIAQWRLKIFNYV